MDIRLPGMNGFEATQRIMTEKPTPIVVVSASVESEDLKITMNALRAGALAVVEKPAGTTQKDYESLASRVCTQLAVMSQVKVIRQRFNRGLNFGSQKVESKQDMKVPVVPAGPFRMLGIVTSTGGPNALNSLLAGLDPKFPLPVVLVQHIAGSFLDGFVAWLNSISSLPVKAAEDGEIPARGKVYVAPADRHLRVDSSCLRLDRGEPVSAQRPSGTVLFQSMASSLGSAALGALLTGMGDDGALGLKAVRDAGGYTIAEDESTAVVFGMPAVAIRLGAACEALPLQEIGPRLTELTRK
jgi:two-component system chemotaxis response regulator CheB